MRRRAQLSAAQRRPAGEAASLAAKMADAEARLGQLPQRLQVRASRTPQNPGPAGLMRLAKTCHKVPHALGLTYWAFKQSASAL